MPHGGYHGTVKMGGKTVQQASRPDGRGGQTGGGRYRPQGYDEPKPSSQTAAELTKQIREQMKADPDPRSAYIGAQADSARLSNLLRQEQEQNLANSVAAGFAKGNARKSDFLGHAGDKSFLGFNYGSTPTAAATVINPITGERIITNKVREGMTSPEYSKYMEGLYSLNPNKMEELFPFASGKTARTVAQQLMPFGNVFSTIADAYKYGSSKVQGGARSFGNNLAGEFSGTVDGIKSLFVKDPSAPEEFIAAKAPEEFVVKKNQSDTLNDFSVDTDEDIFKLPYDLTGSYATATNINPNIIRETKGNYLVNNPTFGLQMIKRAEGGLASINNPDYQRLMGASNFSF